MLVDKKLLSFYGVEASSESLRGYTGIDNKLFLKFIKQKYRIDASISEMMEKRLTLLTEELEHDVIPVPHIYTMMKDVTALPLIRALASSSPRCIVKIVLDQLKLESWFKAVVTGDDVKVAKPNPEIFCKAAKELSIEPAECIVVEDSKNGIDSAIAAGMHTIAFINPLSGEQDLSRAEYQISSLADISALLQETFLY
jgi:HAD superfamily hydrolase (TIGR01509 family)